MAVELNFRKIGEGYPLVILHGLFGSSDNWQRFALRMAENKVEVYTVDLRNHGRSPHHPEHNYKVMAEDVMMLIKNEIKKPVALMGHSMGGKTGMRTALDFPEWIDKLMVLDIAPSAYPVMHDAIMAALKSIDLNSLHSRNDANNMLSEKIKQEDVRQFLLKGLYRDEDNRFKWRFNLDVLEHEMEKIGEAIDSDKPFTKSTLFIRGEKSDYVREEHFTQIKKLFPQSEILTAPAAGHWIHADNPEWLLHCMVRFFNPA
jgi:pimeloyl-ACP methyl ester carboxylesterase